MRYLFILAIAALTITSCSPSHFVVPLQRKSHAVNFSLGGPLINYSNLVIPVPFASLQYGYGWKKKTTVYGGLQLTSAAFGVVHTELGLTHQLFYRTDNKLGLSVSPTFNLMYDKWENHFKFYPQFDMNLYWHFKGENRGSCDCTGEGKTFMYAYVGASNWIELATKRLDGLNQSTNLIFMPQVGINMGSASWKFNFEVKYMGLGTTNNNTVVEYFNPISDKGAIGAYLSVTKIITAKH